MKRDINISITRQEAVVIATALGTLKNRTEYLARWQQTKRKRTLQQRLAVAIAVGDTQEEHQIRQALDHARRRHDSLAARAAGLGGLQARFCRETGISPDERIEYFHLNQEEEQSV